VVFGSVNGQIGSVSVFNYMDGPSFRCAYPDDESLNSPIREGTFSCQISLISMVGAVLANEAIKVLMGAETILSGRLLAIDARTYSFQKKELTKNPRNFA